MFLVSVVGTVVEQCFLLCLTKIYPHSFTKSFWIELAPSCNSVMSYITWMALLKWFEVKEMKIFVFVQGIVS